MHYRGPYADTAPSVLAPAGIRRRLATALLVAATALGACAQGNQPSKLVIEVLVEGLTDELLSASWPLLGEDGLKKLATRGVTIESVDYGPGADALAASAMILTGAEPTVSGIAHATRYDIYGRRVVPTLRDSLLSVQRRTTTTLTSPAALRVTTVADELIIADAGTGTAYGIAADEQTAMLLAGHAGTTAAWIDDADGQWNTSSWHGSHLPQPIAARNFGGGITYRLDTLRWTPTLDTKLYPGTSAAKQKYGFRHTWSDGRDADRYRSFKTSAPGNTEVTAAAVAMLDDRSTTAGGREYIGVAYTLAPYAWGKDADTRMETIDAAVRLDRDLARLMEAAERRAPGQTTIVLAATPAPATGKRDEERFRTPGGQFSARKAQSLLNMYLMAIHGNGDWVTGYHNGQIHLNHALAKRQGIDIADLRREAADFTTRMAGVASTFTIDDLTGRRLGHDSDALLRNTDVAYAGDVFVTVSPGWETVDTDITPSSTPRPQVARASADTYPAYILAPHIESHTIIGDTDARRIAPTVARILRIRSPNGASQRPLSLNKK